MYSLSSLVSGRSMRFVCPFTQWKLNAIHFHHHTIRSCIITMRSQLHFLVWKILSGFGLLAAVTADSLSHKKCTDHIFMIPASNNVPSTASPANSPPSSDRYEVISDWIPSSCPPPRRRIVSSFAARTHQLYPTPNSTDPSGPLVHLSQMTVVLVVL
jgi:hypothetical protein